MVRHVVFRGVSLVGVLLCTACTRASNPDPEAKLELERHEGGYHGGGSTLKLDRAGSYTYHRERWDDRGGGDVTECEGGLEATLAQAWIDRVASLSLVSHTDAAYQEMIGATDSRTEAIYVVYHPSSEAPQMPADASVHESVREEAQGWLSTYEDHRPASESCRVIRDDFGK